VSALEFEAKPYKGPESYQGEDEDVFFGRDAEADQLIAKILSSRFTVVHAQSGAGKTSLINARIIPGLEAKGWSALRIFLQNDPVASIRETTLRHVLPDPIAELKAFRRAKDALVAPGEDSTLNGLLQCYDRLEIRDARRRLLVMPVEVRSKRPGTLSARVRHFTPVFCRVLRSQIEADAFVEHLSAIWPQNSDGEPVRLPLSSDSPLSKFEAILSDPALAAGYDSLLAAVNIPLPSLSAFFEELTQTYGTRVTRFALVLIIDQFEELFTRFIDPGPFGDRQQANLPDWRLRWELFDQLERLCRAEIRVADAPAGKPLPIRVVISIRSEYIAQLDPIRRFAGSFDDNCYHLNLLEKDQAAVAVREPAILFGYSYSDECFSEIIAQLLKEDRFVEPAHLQLVCEKLWNERGRELAAASVRQSKASSVAGLLTTEDRIELAPFEHLGGVKGILRSFFQDFLARLDSSERLETIEMLEPLVTASGTRDIVEYDQLVNTPLRDRNRRERLLRDLIDQTIVRTERRLGGCFVEITHEFLIGPILEAIRSDLEAKAAREFLTEKAQKFERTMVALTPGELVYLYRHRRKIYPTDRELMLLFASMFQNVELTSRHEAPGAYWLAQCSSQDLLRKFILIEHRISQESSSFRLSRVFVKKFPIRELEPQFALLASDQTAAIRAACAEWIGRIKSREALPLLRRLVKDQDPGVRTQAVKSVALFSRLEDLPLLCELVKNHDPEVRGAALEAKERLTRLSRPDDLWLLRELVRDQNSDVKEAALEVAKALPRFSKEEDLPLLRELAQDFARMQVRVSTVETPAGFSKEQDLSLLRRSAKDFVSANVCLSAVKALARFSKEEDLPLLRELVNDPHSTIEVRVASLETLGCFLRPEDLPLLRGLAKEFLDADVRVAAVKVLAKFARGEDLPLLRGLAKSVVDCDVRTAAVKALAKFARREDLPLLCELAKDRKLDVRVSDEATKALANFSPSEALPVLRALVEDRESGVRVAAMETLASFSRNEDLPLLCSLAKKKQDWRLRTGALNSLVSLSRPKDLPLLRQVAKDRDLDVRVRVAAIEVLVSFYRSETQPLLRELIMDTSSDVRVRARAMEALVGLAEVETSQHVISPSHRHISPPFVSNSATR
jgi:HEAT repeat protein